MDRQDLRTIEIAFYFSNVFYRSTATVTDVTTTPFSGLNHIDALLDKGPDWNFLSNSTAPPHRPPTPPAMCRR